MMRLWRSLLIAVVSLSLGACGARGQAIVPGRTANPAPTSAPTTTAPPAATDTVTPDPISAGMEQAQSLLNNDDPGGASIEYTALLGQTNDPAIRQSIFQALEQIGSAAMKAADELYDNDMGTTRKIEACKNQYRLAYDAFKPILQSPDRPADAQEPLFLEAANVAVKMVSCRYYYFPRAEQISYAEALAAFMDELALYPAEPAVQEVLGAGILGTFFDNFYQYHYGSNTEGVINNAKSISSKMGEFLVKGKKVSDWLNFYFVEEDLCAGRPVSGQPLGTSAVKKYVDCDYIYSGLEVDKSGLKATEPGEIWFLLKNETIDAPELQCTLTYEGDIYTYTRRGQFQLVYKLIDVHSGQAATSISFSSTAPTCGVLIGCTVNRTAKTASCNGGGPEMLNSAREGFEPWLEGAVK